MNMRILLATDPVMWFGAIPTALGIVLAALWGIRAFAGNPAQKGGVRLAGAALFVLSSSLYLGLSQGDSGGSFGVWASRGLESAFSTAPVIAMVLLFLTTVFSGLVATDWLFLSRKVERFLAERFPKLLVPKAEPALAIPGMAASVAAPMGTLAAPIGSLRRKEMKDAEEWPDAEAASQAPERYERVVREESEEEDQEWRDAIDKALDTATATPVQDSQSAEVDLGDDVVIESRMAEPSLETEADLEVEVAETEPEEADAQEVNDWSRLRRAVMPVVDESPVEPSEETSSSKTEASHPATVEETEETQLEDEDWDEDYEEQESDEEGASESDDGSDSDDDAFDDDEESEDEDEDEDYDEEEDEYEDEDYGDDDYDEDEDEDANYAAPDGEVSLESSEEADSEEAEEGEEEEGEWEEEGDEDEEWEYEDEEGEGEEEEGEEEEGEEEGEWEEEESETSYDAEADSTEADSSDSSKPEPSVSETSTSIESPPTPKSIEKSSDEDENLVQQELDFDGEVSDQDLLSQLSVMVSGEEPASSDEPVKDSAPQVPVAESSDPFQAAVQYVTSSGRASIATLREGMGVDTLHAARLLHQLETEGVVGASTGQSEREILMTWNQWLERTN